MRWQKHLRLSILAVLLVSFCVPAQTPPASQAVQTGEPLNLRALVQDALERNPEIQAARHSVDAKQARIPQAQAWPDPMITLGYGGNLLPPYTLMRADPSSARQFMAQQEIPYPGKTHLRAEVARRETDAEALAAEAVWRRVVAEVKQRYFELYFTDQSLATLGKDRALLERFEKIAEIRYSVGKGAQQDVLKAQVELTRLAERETLLDESRRLLEAQINSLRDRPPDTPLGPTPELRPSVLTYSLADLQSGAAANFPALKRARAKVDASRLGVSLAEKETRPNITVGYTYMQRAALPDMFGFTFSSTLPIFHRRKQDMAVAEAAANLQASRLEQDNELNQLRLRVQEEFVRVQTSERLMQLYNQGIVPQSNLTLESSLANYETGSADFLSVITNFSAALDAELNYHQQLADHEKALTQLEELTALDLTQ